MPGFTPAPEPGVPSGAILLWSGAISAIPSGWVICDGTNSTPNLTDRFVIHADNDSGGTNDVGDTGGEQSHTLTTNEMPAHKHTINYAGAVDGGNGIYPQANAGTINTGFPAASCSDTGGGAAHENRPKFYALAYIMKS